MKVQNSEDSMDGPQRNSHWTGNSLFNSYGIKGKQIVFFKVLREK